MLKGNYVRIDYRNSHEVKIVGEPENNNLSEKCINTSEDKL